MTKYYPPRLKAKEKIKISPETFKCPFCSKTIYTGKRSIEAIKLKFPEAEVGKIDVDHIKPVVPVDGIEPSWDTLINNMFSDEENWQALCNECHKKKSKEENAIRRVNKKS